MNSENQDCKTEPASQATVWGFGIGKFGGPDQLCNTVILGSQVNITRISEMLGQLVAAMQTQKAGAR